MVGAATLVLTWLASAFASKVARDRAYRRWGLGAPPVAARKEREREA